MSHLLELVDESDKNNDGKIDFEEWTYMGTSFSHMFILLPEASDIKLVM